MFKCEIHRNIACRLEPDVVVWTLCKIRSKIANADTYMRFQLWRQYIADPDCTSSWDILT